MSSCRVFDVSGVLREASWLPRKNGKLSLSVALLVLLPFSLLVLLQALTLGPSIEEIEDGEYFSSEHQNVVAFVVAELILLVLLALLSLCAMTATISSSSAVYAGESLTLHELLHRISAKWSRPASMFLPFLLISGGYILVMILLVGASEMVVGDIIVGQVGIGLMGVAVTLFFIYLAAIGLLGVVVSVVEDDWHGTRANIGRAAEELIDGRKLQVFVLMLIYVLLSTPVYAIFLVNMVDDELSAVIHVVVGTVTTISICLMGQFTVVVFTVFYCKCKTNPDQKEEEGAECSLVSTYQN